MNNETCYLISAGQYSDYGVEAVVVGSEKLAHDIAAAMNVGNDSYEKYAVEQRPMLTDIPVRITAYHANAWIPGAQPEIASIDLWPWEMTRWYDKPDKLVVQETGFKRIIRFHCWSQDADKAIKIVSDAYYAYIANNPQPVFEGEMEIPF